jgi:hypothetical protein
VVQSYAGLYRNRNNEEIRITLENGELFYQKTGGPKWKVSPYAKDNLFFDNTSTIGEMKRDARGEIIAFAMQTLRGMDKNVITRVLPTH